MSARELIPYQFDGHDIRVVHVDGEPHFVGKDVCEALNHSNASKAMGDHCKGVTKRYPLLTAGGMQEMRILTEADVLRLIVSSTLPSALAFERWVFEEVLPSIRRTGTYSMPQISESSTAPRGKDESGLPAMRKAKALQMNIESAKALCEMFPQLGTQAKQTIFSKVVGVDVIQLPLLESQTYSAGEVGAKLGVSANQVGRLSNAHGLKTTEYGMFVLDKSRSSDKQVESFRYNDAGVAKLATLLGQPHKPAQGDLLGGEL